MFPHQFPQLEQLFRRVEVAGRIVRIADEDGLGLVRDGVLEIFGGRQREPVFYSGCDSFYRESGSLGETQIVRIARFRDNHLVARVEYGEKRRKQRLRAACSDDYFVRGQVNAEFPVVVPEFFTQGRCALTRAVLQRFPVNVLECGQCLFRCRKIRLADIQMIDFKSTFLGIFRERSQFAYW